jgi:predicted dinucleotide-binding enzyme
MKIGIIGTGRVGGGLGKRWAHAGHQVMFGSRNPDKARLFAAETGADTSAGSYQETVAFADLLLLATPWGDATESTIRALGSVDGKILIETTNNFVDKNPVSTTERIMAWASGAKVVKAFNVIFASIIAADPATLKVRPDVFIVGDDADAKQIVSGLIHDLGFGVVDVGPAKNAHHVEKLGQLIVELGYAQGMSTNIAFRLEKVVA